MKQKWWRSTDKNNENLLNYEEENADHDINYCDNSMFNPRIALLFYAHVLRLSKGKTPSDKIPYDKTPGTTKPPMMVKVT